MQNANVDIILLFGGLTALVLVIALLVLARALGKGRKQTKERLEKLRQRFKERTSLRGEQVRSIRLKQESTGLADYLAAFMPRRDQIQARLAKAGLEVDLSRYTVISVTIFTIAFAVFAILGLPIVLALLLGFILGAGLPHAFVGIKIKRRLTLFSRQFPEALDLMVRGLKSGLPVNECIASIAREMTAPTGTEFQKIADSMRLGKQLEEALWETADRLDTPDFKFFVISLVVQRETGGNLGETLGNLSMILRQRQAMKLKVAALSSEAKASAWIVGALPPIMLGLIMTMNYDYGIILFTHPKAIIAGIVAITWMALGIFIMSKMIKFEV